MLHGLPKFIRSDNGAEFTTPNIRHWLKRLGVTTMFIEPGSPWEI
jgi:putative transposase